MRRQKQLFTLAYIAVRDVHFFLKTAEHVRRMRPDVDFMFVSFFQAGNKLVKEKGFNCIDLYEYSHAFDFDLQDIERFEALYRIENMHKLLVHEKYTFNINNSGALLKKFMAYLAGLDSAFAPLRKIYGNDNIYVMQELGGFIAPLALFYVSQRYHMKHVFFEPAYFKGRLFDVVDSLDPIQLPKTADGVIEPACATYIQQTLTEKQVVIPAKDRHHFADMSLSKIANFSNLTKLLFKLKHKYINRERQEYEHIWNHTHRYLKMYINRKRNNTLYVPFDKDLKQRSYVYFPFHVQLDYALTVRSPAYLNQLALLEYVCSILPAGMLLLAKEHPASIGGFSYCQLKLLLKRFDNFRLIHPSENSYDLLSAATAVLTINSKVGAEALTAGKEVVVMGKSFYSDSRLVHHVPHRQDLGSVFYSIRNGLRKNDEKERSRFFSALWSRSYPTELYNLDDENIEYFALHLCDYLAPSIEIDSDRYKDLRYCTL